MYATLSHLAILISTGAIASSFTNVAPQHVERRDDTVGDDGTNAAVHLNLARRSGRFVDHSILHLGELAGILHRVEARYSQTGTDCASNNVVRSKKFASDDPYNSMFATEDDYRPWYTTLEIGTPPQTLEVDIDMLVPDFYTSMTSSGQGSKYDTFSSSTHEESNDYAHPLCRTPIDMFHLPGKTSPARLTLPLCQANKYSSNTLLKSGTVLGLAPPGAKRALSHLSDTNTLLEQLLSQDIVRHNLASVTLLDATSGILSLGGTIAPLIEEAKVRVEKELNYLDRVHVPEEREKMENEINGYMSFAMPPGSTHEDHFKWVDTSNMVAGWHQALASGIWINGVKVLKNQPVLFDINCPFILAPVGPAKAFHEAIPGARRLNSLLDDATEEAHGLFAFPCLIGVDIEFELAGWRFPFGRGEVREDAVLGPVGGSLSLGQVDLRSNKTALDETVGTGYCGSIVVESGMGVRKEWQNSAMQDVWVLGEPFFRGIGVVFDMGDDKGKGSRIGFRVY